MHRERNFIYQNKLLTLLVVFGAVSFLGFLKKRKSPLHTAGQTRETIDFTSRLVAEGKMTKEEKLRLDNIAIRENSLANLLGFSTYAEEKPGEWEEFLKKKQKTE